MTKIWQGGDALIAEDLNKVNRDTDKRFLPLEHNVLEIYMENYFSNKITPYQGLVFDGLGNSLKKHLGDGVISAAASGQKNVDLLSASQLASFSVGDKIHLYNATYQELHEIASKPGAITNYLVDDATCATPTFSGSATVGDQGVSGGKRNLAFTGNPTSGSYYGTLTKVVATTNGVTYNLQIKLTGNTFNGTNALSCNVKVDGTSKYSKTWTDASEVQVDTTFVGNGSNMTITIEWTEGTGLNSFFSYAFGSMRDFYVSSSVYRLTTVNNLANTLTGGTAKACSATFDTANLQLLMTAGLGDLKLATYQFPVTTFQQAMSRVNLWVMRGISAKKAVKTSISQGATSVTVTATSGTFSSGDTIELKSNDTLTRERKTLTSVTVNGSDLILNFTGQGVVNAGGFTTNDWVERVDVLPEVSLTDSGATWVTPTYVRSEEVIVDTLTRTEDLYTYEPATAAKIFRTLLKITRGDTSLAPSVKRIGASLCQ